LAQTFSLYAWSFHFRAIDPLTFPPSFATNTLRGALGLAFRNTDLSAYTRIFAPASDASAREGLRDLPRPFVLRAAALDGLSLQPDEKFRLGIHNFDERHPALHQFTRAFELLGRTGLGPAKARVELESVSSRHLTLPAVLDAENTSSRLTVRFLTPTELKVGSAVATQPHFDVLIARTMERIDNLRRLYGDGSLDIDLAEALAIAGTVSIMQSKLHHVKAHRRSGRTGQAHPLGGFAGEVRYEGPVGRFLQMLRIAEWTGVGRQTTWGKGTIELGQE